MSKATTKKATRPTKRKQPVEKEPTLKQALEWLSSHYPAIWSPKAVCSWVAAHPTVHRLLLARMQAFADIIKSGIDIDDIGQLKAALAALGGDDDQ